MPLVSPPPAPPLGGRARYVLKSDVEQTDSQIYAVGAQRSISMANSSPSMTETADNAYLS